jgi:hypothetical protein
MTTRVLTIGLVIMTVIGLSVWAADAKKPAPAPPPITMKAGVARVKITPTEPVLMAGYANRVKPSERVESDLWAKALAFEDAGGHRSVIITTDLLGLHDAMVTRIAERIKTEKGLERADLLFNSSHTHAAPWPWVMSDLSEVAAEDVEATKRWHAKLEKKLGDVIIEAMEAMKPARLSLGGGVAPFVMNRREFTSRGIILGVNPRGLADRSVPVMRVEDAKGNTFAVLFGCACHNTTTSSDNSAIDGDYAGYAQLDIETHLPGVTALFIAGCEGDANPWPRGTLLIAKQHGATLGGEVRRVLTETKLTPISGPIATRFMRINLPLAPAPSADELQKVAEGKGGGWQKYVAEMQLKKQAGQASAVDHYAAPLAVWQFGGDLTLVGLSGEVVSGYVPLIEKAVGPLKLWISAYCNDVYGYIPTKQTLEEGGYETRGMYRAEAVGQFAPAVQDVVIEGVKKLASDAGRK